VPLEAVTARPVVTLVVIAEAAAEHRAVVAVDRAAGAEAIPEVAANSDCFAFPLRRPRNPGSCCIRAPRVEYPPARRDRRDRHAFFPSGYRMVCVAAGVPELAAPGIPSSREVRSNGAKAVLLRSGFLVEGLRRRLEKFRSELLKQRNG
jgi:hypothetical protein